jgi:hypothetical protein
VTDHLGARPADPVEREDESIDAAVTTMTGLD